MEVAVEISVVAMLCLAHMVSKGAHEGKRTLLEQEEAVFFGQTGALENFLADGAQRGYLFFDEAFNGGGAHAAKLQQEQVQWPFRRLSSLQTGHHTSLKTVSFAFNQNALADEH
jgi:hypothetical protein